MTYPYGNSAEVNNVVLSFTNDGALQPWFREAVKGNIGMTWWRMTIRANVKASPHLFDPMSTEQVNEAADLLKAYYVEQAAELAAYDASQNGAQ